MPPVTPEVQAFATGFPVTLLHAGATALMLLLGAGLYALLTPYKDLQLIREGNTAAAISLGAIFVGLALPLSMSLAAGGSAGPCVNRGLANATQPATSAAVVSTPPPGESCSELW